MRASERQRSRRRIAAGLPGTLAVLLLLPVPMFYDDGLTWSTVATAATIIAIGGVVTPIVIYVSEDVRRSRRPRD
jgi:hypothetical protein